VLGKKSHGQCFAGSIENRRRGKRGCKLNLIERQKGHKFSTAGQEDNFTEKKSKKGLEVNKAGT